MKTFGEINSLIRTIVSVIALIVFIALAVVFWPDDKKSEVVVEEASVRKPAEKNKQRDVYYVDQMNNTYYTYSEAMPVEEIEVQSVQTNSLPAVVVTNTSPVIATNEQPAVTKPEFPPPKTDSLIQDGYYRSGTTITYYGYSPQRRGGWNSRNAPVRLQNPVCPRPPPGGPGGHRK
jgi:hypothetical protein